MLVKQGIRRGSLLFCIVCAVGQLLFTLGVSHKTFVLCAIGRFVYAVAVVRALSVRVCSFGIGGRSLAVAQVLAAFLSFHHVCWQSAFIVRWFSGRGLAFCFSFVDALNGLVRFPAGHAMTCCEQADSATYFVFPALSSTIGAANMQWCVRR